jgi:hypothetical protein
MLSAELDTHLPIAEPRPQRALRIGLTAPQLARA